MAVHTYLWVKEKMNQTCSAVVNNCISAARLAKI